MTKRGGFILIPGRMPRLVRLSAGERVTSSRDILMTPEAAGAAIDRFVETERRRITRVPRDSRRPLGALVWGIITPHPGIQDLRLVRRNLRHKTRHQHRLLTSLPRGTEMAKT